MKPLISYVAGAAASLLAAPAIAAVYDPYDYNRNARLDESEYVDYSYDRIDADRSGTIEQDEWNNYSTSWYAPYDDVRYSGYSMSYYDSNNDGVIDREEYAGSYDRNLYNAWDLDNNGSIDADEYNQVSRLYGDASMR